MLKASVSQIRPKCHKPVTALDELAVLGILETLLVPNQPLLKPVQTMHTYLIQLYQYPSDKWSPLYCNTWIWPPRS